MENKTPQSKEDNSFVFLAALLGVVGLAIVIVIVKLLGIL
jgi:hypothetical protein